MKRCISALVASITLALGAGVSVASASGDEFVPPPNHTLSQSNESDQGQIQVVPIAPQVNVQNANVATFDDVEQGDANNANTGQASQQENTATAAAAPVSTQSNDSDQSQIQVVPIAPQVNVQNANVATFDDVEQGDANNANTGQANQQENTSSAGHGGPTHHSTCGSCSKPSSGGAQKNDSDQKQIQVVPIAPQVNVQNVNIATFDDVEQGDANNANTGQASQQENTSTAGHGGPSQHSKCGSCSKPSSGGWQKNDSDQSQIQVVPIAPQVNVQNVNVATFDDVEQGDVNNANTGQANQQENTKTGSGGSSSGGWQKNDSDQSQIQIVPIAPQVNVQNVNIATFDDVEQGDANNANTGQANQQENTLKGGHGAPAWSSKCGSCSKSSSGGGQKNESDQSQIQIVPIAPQKNLQNVNVFTFGDVEQGDVNNANTGQASQQENISKGGHGGPAWSKCGSCSKSSGGGWQTNESDQKQIQIVPIAPQKNVQNVNLFTFGDVEQGDANNANTGQANQQSNWSSGGKSHTPPCHSSCGPPKPPCGCHPKPEPCECKPAPKPCECKPAPRPCECKPHPRPCECKPHPRPEPKPAPKPCDCKPAPKPCECKPAPKPCECKPAPKPKHCECKPAPKECGCHAKKSSGQSNKSSQKQIQIVPIAPQLNVQNVNLFTFGDVEQGNANNANTGQANQQHNTLKGGHGKAKPDNHPPVSKI